MMHAFLEVGKRFATWITERISEYEFVENEPPRESWRLNFLRKR